VPKPQWWSLRLSLRSPSWFQGAVSRQEEWKGRVGRTRASGEGWRGKGEGAGKRGREKGKRERDSGAARI